MTNTTLSFKVGATTCKFRLLFASLTRNLSRSLKNENWVNFRDEGERRTKEVRSFVLLFAPEAIFACLSVEKKLLHLTNCLVIDWVKGKRCWKKMKRGEKKTKA